MVRTGLCFGLAFAMAAFAGTTDQNGTKTRRSEQNRTEMQNPKAKLSRDVSQLLMSTEKARTAISQRKHQQATRDVNQALNDANTAVSEHSGADLVPIYTELERMSVIEPIMRARNNNNRTGSADRTATAAQNKRPVAVHEVVGGETSVSLDVNAAQKHLQAAQQALSKNDWKTADQDLKAVQDSVVVESVAADMPLLRVRENLVLARSSAEAGHYQRASEQLRAASRALEAYEKSSTAHRQDADRLRNDINSYAQTMAKNHSDAPNKIESWWNNTTEWINPSNSQANTASNSRPHSGK